MQTFLKVMDPINISSVDFQGINIDLRHNPFLLESPKIGQYTVNLISVLFKKYVKRKIVKRKKSLKGIIFVFSHCLGLSYYYSNKRWSLSMKGWVCGPKDADQGSFEIRGPDVDQGNFQKTRTKWRTVNLFGKNSLKQCSLKVAMLYLILTLISCGSFLYFSRPEQMIRLVTRGLN